MIKAITHLSNQKEGSDYFWDTCEKFLITKVEEENDVLNKTNAIVKSLLAYWKLI